MKTVFLTVFLLSLTASGEAGEILGAKSKANEFFAPNQAWMMMDEEYNRVLSSNNYEECRTGKVKCLIYLDPNFGVMVTKEGTDCLAKMEAAMRAMDEVMSLKPSNTGWPEIGTAFYPDTRTEEQILSAEQLLLDKRKDRLKNLRTYESKELAMKQLWESTKRDCWSNP